MDFRLELLTPRERRLLRMFIVCISAMLLAVGLYMRPLPAARVAPPVDSYPALWAARGQPVLVVSGPPDRPPKTTRRPRRM